MNKFITTLFVFFIVSFPLFAQDYTVDFEGIESKELLQEIKEHSDLIKLQKKLPKTATALKRRVENDIKIIVEVLHNHAYYNARVNYQLIQSEVKIVIEPGPIYPLNSFTIEPASNDCPLFLQEISLDDLAISLEKPAVPSMVLNAEEQLLSFLAKNGYPYARIKERAVLANQQKKNVDVILTVECGPLVYFGDTTVTGLTSIHSCYINKHICWRPGKSYDHCKVEKTRNRLEETGLFSSIIIEGEKVEDDDHIPMHIAVTESKHKTIGYGLSYSTQRGPGIAAEWENRNFRGTGERLNFNVNIAGRLREGTLLYTIPHYKKYNQDLIWLCEVRNEITDGFHDVSIITSGKINKKINSRSRIAYGGMYKFLHDTHSDDDGDFHLLKIPVEYFWSNANSVLDPTYGTSFYFKTEPSTQLTGKKFGYCINELSLSSYLPLNRSCSWILATKLTAGSIIGTSRSTIPPSERFYAGTENLLRGYNYMTVSPLDVNRKPIGGRSMMVFTVEPRFRFSDTWGAVLFYEAGNVYSEVFPQFRQPLLQDVGIGLRYFTPVGPLRLDFAVPLNKRKKVDNNYQIYFSIGQAF